MHALLKTEHMHSFSSLYHWAKTVVHTSSHHLERKYRSEPSCVDWLHFYLFMRSDSSHRGHPFLRTYLWWSLCTLYIYSHARWSYRRRFRSLLLRPLSVERYNFPLFVGLYLCPQAFMHSSLYFSTHLNTCPAPYRDRERQRQITVPLLLYPSKHISSALQRETETETDHSSSILLVYSV